MTKLVSRAKTLFMPAAKGRRNRAYPFLGEWQESPNTHVELANQRSDSMVHQTSPSTARRQDSSTELDDMLSDHMFVIVTDLAESCYVVLEGWSTVNTAFGPHACT
jgi:hypothetical protein